MRLHPLPEVRHAVLNRNGQTCRKAEDRCLSPREQPATERVGRTEGTGKNECRIGPELFPRGVWDFVRQNLPPK